MSAFYYGPQQQQQQQHHQPSAASSHSSSSHNHHGGRSRRAPRLSASQNSHRQFRGVRSMKELTEPPAVSASRRAFELARSFDPEDDFEFCRGLWTEDDVSATFGPHPLPSSSPSFMPRPPTSQHRSDQSCRTQLQDYSSSSDGSLSSGSPNLSPVQPQTQPTQQLQPTFSLATATENNYNPITGFQSNSNNMKLHQPSALRTRNAIPIVNPSTGMRVPSPPSSISPAMMQQQTYGGRRW